MDNKELKEKIEQIMKKKAVLGTVGDVLEEIDFEDVAEEIVNLLPIHDVSKRKHQNTYDWGYINGYDDCNKGLPKRDDLGVYDD